MKNSNVFNAMERVLSEIENLMEYSKEALKEAENELKELPSDVDNWKKENTQNRIKRYEIEVMLYKEAYNYIYMNFQKIVKSL